MKECEGISGSVRKHFLTISHACLFYCGSVVSVVVQQCGLTGASAALGVEGGSSCGEGVSWGRVHHAGVEGRVGVGPEGCRDTRR